MANIYSWYQENCDAGNKETMIRVPMDNGCKVTHCMYNIVVYKYLYQWLLVPQNYHGST